MSLESQLVSMKGEFEWHGGAIRHKTLVDSAGNKSCPLNALCQKNDSEEQFANSDVEKMSNFLDIDYFQAGLVVLASDGNTFWPELANLLGL